MEQITAFSSLMLRTVVVFLALFLLVPTSHAQDATRIRTDFADSYQYEYVMDYGLAIESCKKTYLEQSYEANLRLGWLYYLSKDFLVSQAYYKKAIALRPRSIEARFGYVYPTGDLGNWDEVAGVYHDILAIDAQNSTANYRLGLIHYNKGEFAKATKFLEIVEEMYPFSYNGVSLLAWTYLRLEKMQEAKVLFERALLISPGDTSATEGLGMIK